MTQGIQELVSEFFYDGICRIVPGIAFIVVYGGNTLTNAFDKYSLAVGLGVLLAAWMAGLLIEIITFVVPAMLSQWAENSVKYCVPVKKAEKQTWEWRRIKCIGDLRRCLIPDETPQKKVVRDEKTERRELKFMAEKTMFRGMGFLCVMAWFWNPTKVLGEPLSKDDWQLGCAVGFGIFFAGWLFAFRHAKQVRERQSEKP